MKPCYRFAGYVVYVDVVAARQFETGNDDWGKEVVVERNARACSPRTKHRHYALFTNAMPTARATIVMLTSKYSAREWCALESRQGVGSVGAGMSGEQA